MLFKTNKPQPQPFYLADFNSELAALIAKAIGARIHLVDIRNALDNKIQAVDFQYAQRSVI
jgi:hypothetical protein